MLYACVYTHMSARSDEWPPTDVRADEWPPTDEWPPMLCARVCVFVDTTSAHTYTLTRTHVTTIALL